MASICYSSRSYKRANRAVACGPFRLALFQTLQHQSVDLRAIVMAHPKSQGAPIYLKRPLPELVVEQALLWLIQVGLLRRDVDGQGITDSFRLTPLGSHLLEQWLAQGQLPRPSLMDHLYNSLSRWFGL